MIKRAIVNGREATVANFGNFIKVLFDDGEMVLLGPAVPKGASVKGLSLARWAEHFAKEDATRIDSTVRNGLTEGLVNTEIARRVVGSFPLRGTDGVTEITRQRIASLGRATLKPRKRTKS